MDNTVKRLSFSSEPKSGKVSKQKPGSLRRIKLDYYFGNEWERPMSQNEWTFLLAFWREMAFFVDYVKASKKGYRNTTVPETQILRQFAAWNRTVQLVLVCYFAYFVAVWLI